MRLEPLSLDHLDALTAVALDPELWKFTTVNIRNRGEMRAYIEEAVKLQNAGTVMEHRKLLRRVWGPAYLDERNYLRTFVQRLRAKLEANPEVPRAIVTVGGRGYRFGEPPVPD